MNSFSRIQQVFLSPLSRILLMTSLGLSMTFGEGGLHFSDTSAGSSAEIHFMLADSLSDTDFGMQNSTYAHLDLDGKLHKSFTFNADVLVFTEIGDRVFPYHDYEPFRGIPYNLQADTVGFTESDKRTWDYFTANSRWDLDILVLMGGVGFLESGPALRNKLTWAGNHQTYRPWQAAQSKVVQRAPLIYGGFSMEIGPVRYDQYFGALSHLKAKDKYFHNHRLSIQLWNFGELGLNESIIYGSSVETDTITRSLEPLYALPFVPYFFAEHYNGDQDNKGMSFDLKLTPPQWPAWMLYSELHMDDMRSPPKGFVDDSWWGNKWALSTGLQFSKHFDTQSLNWFMEYTRIEPWIYTHALGAGYSYSHYGQSLGSSLGPNSREIYTEAMYSNEMLFPAALRLFAGRVWKGTDYGSSYEDVHVDGVHADDKCFLCDTPDSPVRSYLQLGGAFRIDPIPYLILEGGAERFLSDFKEWDSYRLWGKVGVRY